MHHIDTQAPNQQVLDVSGLVFLEVKNITRIQPFEGLQILSNLADSS
jgi:hypothetical protein